MIAIEKIMRIKVFLLYLLSLLLLVWFSLRFVSFHSLSSRPLFCCANFCFVRKSKEKTKAVQVEYKLKAHTRVNMGQAVGWWLAVRRVGQRE